eukprot:1357564-Amorphochlora_amoeboformis.AAC.1
MIPEIPGDCIRTLITFPVTSAMDKLDKSIEEIIDDEKKTTPSRGRGGGRGRGGRNRRAKEGRVHPYKSSGNNRTGGGRKGPRNLKVGGSSNVKSVAGSIAKTTRESEAPTVLAIGVDAINQAVKAITIARIYLEENNVDLRAQTDFEDLKGFKTTTRLFKASQKPRGPKIDKDDLCVKSGSDHFKVAGAIAARVRDGLSVGIYAKGSEAVSTMVKSVT